MALGPGPVDLSTQGTVRTASSISAIGTQLGASVAGDTVQIAAGTYGALTITRNIASGLIRLVPAAGATVTFASVTFSNAQGIDFRGMPVTGTGGRGFYFDNSTRINVRGGVNNVPNTLTCFEVRENCDNITCEDFEVHGALNSIYWQAFSDGAASTNLLFQRYQSTDVSQDHVFISRGSGIIQDFEHFRHTESTEHQDGIQIVGGKDVTIRRGKIHNTRTFRDAASDRNDHGVIINYTPGEGRVPERITVEDLEIHDMTSTGIAIAGGFNLKVRNCTSYDNGLGGNTPGLIVDPDPGNTVTIDELTNNIFNSVSITGATITVNNSNFVADGSGPAHTGKLTGSPGFTSSATEDYSLTSSSQNVDSANATYAPAVDILGNARTTPDRGAYERTTGGGGAGVAATIRSRSSVAQTGPITGGTLSLTKPTGTAVGDRLVVKQWQTVDGTAASMTAPAGWTQVGTTGVQDAGAGTGMRGKIWEKVVAAGGQADGTDVPTSIAFGFDSAGSVDGGGLDCECYQTGTFATGSAFWNAGPTWGGSTTSATAQVAPTISPTVINTLLVCAAAEHAFNNLNTYTPPSGMTERLDIEGSGNYISFTAADEVRAASGATGTRTFTATRSAVYLSVSYSVAPATSPSGAVAMAATAAMSLSGAITKLPALSVGATASTTIGGRADHTASAAFSGVAALSLGGLRTLSASLSVSAASALALNNAFAGILRSGVLPVSAVASMALLPSPILHPFSVSMDAVAGMVIFEVIIPDYRPHGPVKAVILEHGGRFRAEIWPIGGGRRILLTDDFSEYRDDDWFYGTTAALSDGHLVQQSLVDYSAVVIEKSTHDMTGSEVIAELLQPSAGGTNPQTLSYLFIGRVDGSEAIFISVTGGLISASHRHPGFVDVGVGSIPYAGQQFLRIREDDGTMYFAASHDREEWNEFASWVRDFNLNPMRVEIGTGNWSGSPVIPAIWNMVEISGPEVGQATDSVPGLAIIE